MDDDYGQQDLHILHEELAKGPVCVAFSENIVTGRADKNAFHIVQVIKTSTAKAVVFFATDYEIIPVLDELLRQNVTGKMWIASDSWATSTPFLTGKFSVLLMGTIALQSQHREILGVQNCHSSLTPSRNPDYSFIREFWEEAFGCKWMDHKHPMTAGDNKTVLCNGAEDLESFYMSNNIKNVFMPRRFGTGRYFDEHGNPPALYDIINWQRSRDGSLRQEKVVSYNSSATLEETLMVNISAIQWASRSIKNGTLTEAIDLLMKLNSQIIEEVEDIADDSCFRALFSWVPQWMADIFKFLGALLIMLLLGFCVIKIIIPQCKKTAKKAMGMKIMIDVEPGWKANDLTDKEIRDFVKASTHAPEGTKFLKMIGETLVIPITANLVSQKLVPGCQLQMDEARGFSQDGSVLIGGIFPVHDARVYQSIRYAAKPAPITCQTFVFDNYQWLQAMLFAIDEINGNPDLLPNVTLGFQIYDSCRMLPRALEGTLWILSGRDKPVLNYQCWGSRRPVAIIGDSTSTRSILMARILGLYRYPQISYSATSPLLSDRNQFPSFFRTIPSDDFQSRGLAELVMYFGWTWVGLVATNDDYGQQGLRILQEELSKGATCVAFTESIITSQADKNAFHITQVIKNSTARAVVFFATDYDMIPILDELLRQNVTGKIWIASEGWSTSAIFSMEKFSEILSGTVGFENHNGEMPGFQDYLISLSPFQSPNYIFIREFWEEAFGCKWLDQERQLNVLDNKTKLCTGVENLLINQKYVTSFRFTYNIYTAVYAVALAVQDLMSCAPGEGPFHHGSCANVLDVHPWQFLHSIKNVYMPPRFGAGKCFDEHGNPRALYDIVNWQYTPQGSLRHVLVGRYDSSSLLQPTLLVNVSAIQWAPGNMQVPVSLCSASCPYGFRKVAKEGEPVCCFQCVQCPQGEISHLIDSAECSKCPWDQWPNEQQDQCIPKTMEFLSYEDPLGATLAATSMFSSTIPIAIMGLFLNHRNTPIVRANNRSVSFILLLSLTLCFLSSLVFIGFPTMVKCLLRQAAFGITFALCVSCILAKTIMVVIAFNATKPNSDLRRWLRPQVSCVVISVCTLFQAILCASWLILSPPFSEYNSQIQPGKIIAECNEGSPIAFWSMLGYLGFLATISFLVAFLARKLPDSFNEAQFITFSMLAFLSVWLSFIPAYLSTRGKYMVAMEVFAIFSSSFALVCCLFFHKCYIILLRPSRNSRGHLLSREQGTGHRRQDLLL
ncbi:vomeronasal type-2 receptor 1-like [Ambystoma mexicanum]|uniref:vomeronasal type-2 receptor 1-like n=1 Tax=Ambystoma mexicanum TaxID=8296 RepID=UPI0037E72416